MKSIMNIVNTPNENIYKYFSYLTNMEINSDKSFINNSTELIKKLNINTLKNEIISTADYIVKKEFDGTEILLTPKINQQAIQIEKLPYQIGYSKYESKN